MMRRPSLRMATIAVVATCSLLVASLATVPRSAETDSSGSGPDRAAQGGGGADVGEAPFHPVVLTDSNKPQAKTLTHPNQLSLKAAESKVFNLKTLKSDVVKLERPENDNPGELDEDAPSGEDTDSLTDG